jgi:hypothetical protein
MDYQKQRELRGKIRKNPIAFLREKGFSKELERLKNGQCVGCGILLTDALFVGHDVGYAKEAALSGICPKCLDGVSNIREKRGQRR